MSDFISVWSEKEKKFIRKPVQAKDKPLTFRTTEADSKAIARIAVAYITSVSEVLYEAVHSFLENFDWRDVETVEKVIELSAKYANPTRDPEAHDKFIEIQSEQGLVASLEFLLKLQKESEDKNNEQI